MEDPSGLALCLEYVLVKKSCISLTWKVEDSDFGGNTPYFGSGNIQHLCCVPGKGFSVESRGFTAPNLTRPWGKTSRMGLRVAGQEGLPDPPVPVPNPPSHPDPGVPVPLPSLELCLHSSECS